VNDAAMPLPPIPQRGASQFNNGSASAILQTSAASVLGAVSATENDASLLHAMSDDSATAMSTHRRQQVDRTLETVKCVLLTGECHLKCFVVVVATDFAFGHLMCSLERSDLRAIVARECPDAYRGIHDPAVVRPSSWRPALGVGVSRSLCGLIEPLSELEQRRQERAPIDHFFRTLANTHDGEAIGIILTGTGSDGTLGIREIKERGGLTIVLDRGKPSTTACLRARSPPAWSI
jgi:hypothetical protein